MWYAIAGLTMLKSFSPYFRKHVLKLLESHEFLFINSFIVSICVLLFFIYKLVIHPEDISKTFTPFLI